MCLALILVIISTLQSCVAEKIEKDRVAELNSTELAKDVPCRVESFNEQGKMQLNCGNRGRHELLSVSLALAYATNHKPLVCTLYRGNPPSCEARKTKWHSS